MANATAPVKSKARVVGYQQIDKYPVAAGATIYQGQMVGFNSSGLLVGTAFLGVIGRACSTVVAAAAGAMLEVEEGILLWTNLAGAVTATARGKKCYAADNQSVNLTNTNPPCGVVYDVTSDGVWVLSTIQTYQSILGT